MVDHTTAYVAPPFIWLIGGFVIVYLWAVFRLLGYLERAHNQAWLKLGSPSLSNFGILNSFRLIGFIFGDGYKSLPDARVAEMVWTIRALLAITVAMMLYAKFAGIGR